MFRAWLVEKFLKENWNYDVDLAIIDQWHKKTDKKELIKIICELMDRYNYLLKHKKTMSFYNLTKK